MEEISDCSLDKLTNDQCEEECNNAFCMQYDATSIDGGSFDFSSNTVVTVQDSNGTVYAADGFQCPWNGSVTTSTSNSSESDLYPLCNVSSAESPYLDPNLPDEIICRSEWIDDGVGITIFDPFS